MADLEALIHESLTLFLDEIANYTSVIYEHQRMLMDISSVVCNSDCDDVFSLDVCLERSEDWLGQCCNLRQEWLYNARIKEERTLTAPESRTRTPESELAQPAHVIDNLNGKEVARDFVIHARQSLGTAWLWVWKLHTVPLGRGGFRHFRAPSRGDYGFVGVRVFATVLEAELAFVMLVREVNPGNPEKAYQQPEMEMAFQTASGQCEDVGYSAAPHRGHENHALVYPKGCNRVQLNRHGLNSVVSDESQGSRCLIWQVQCMSNATG
ncbi:hypothetical protein PAXRUDRAFT_28508 [Paxillus rubicundulus Ve08.2h10]|uniref:Uncharacterized protein n=1 Tax=Paxillus rubicundulus Ve08.2h10 TaxID=930991 RepID=A0A0D0C7P9_9AGAM|nr:hypothetical protein PAXRUDRAFT_28508 [Paxillus rubicundulus Ve08.2h10]